MISHQDLLFLNQVRNVIFSTAGLFSKKVFVLLFFTVSKSFLVKITRLLHFNINGIFVMTYVFKLVLDVLQNITLDRIAFVLHFVFTAKHINT